MNNVRNNKFVKSLKLMAVFCLICTVILSGCVNKGQNNTNNSEQNDQNNKQAANITPEANETVNTTKETKQVVTETDSGKTINLKNGETFSLKLEENPTTGYSWQLNLSQRLSILGDEYIKDTYPGETEVPEGRGGVHIWEIKAVSPGSQQVKGTYKQPWMDTTGNEDNFSLNVKVS